MEKIPEKIDFNEVYSLYEGRRDDADESVNIESIDISDRTDLQNRMNQAAQEAVSSYQQIRGDNANGAIKDWPEVRVNSVPISARVVDDSIPLTLFVMKTFKHDKISNEHSETVMVQLIKGNLDGDNPKALYASWKAKLAEGSVIGGLDFANRGEVFDLRDREIYPKFRKQGFANMLLKTSEEFIHGMATQDQAARISQAGDVGQLDVLCWLWNQGYRPQTDEEMDLVQKIFSGDSSLCLSTLKEPGGGQTLSLCVIDANTPEHERIRQNYHRIAKRVNLVKKIEPGNSKGVADIGDGVRRRVENLTSPKSH